jgi:hypothetical protein
VQKSIFSFLFLLYIYLKNDIGVQNFFINKVIYLKNCSRRDIAEKLRKQNNYSLIPNMMLKTYSVSNINICLTINKRLFTMKVENQIQQN